MSRSVAVRADRGVGPCPEVVFVALLLLRKVVVQVLLLPPPLDPLSLVRDEVGHPLPGRVGLEYKYMYMWQACMWQACMWQACM